MFRRNKLSTYLIVSFLFHVIIGFAMSKIYAEQPQRIRHLEIVSAVRIQYKEPNPPSRPEVVTRVQPTKHEEIRKKALPREKPKVTRKVEPTRVEKQEAKVPGLALESAPRPDRGSSGTIGLKGTRGSPGDRPGMTPASGISHPTLTTKTGGSGLSSDRIYGGMELPEGSSHLPGAGGKDIAGFQVGVSRTGRGAGRIDISGRGGSGGSGGKGDEGPGKGLPTGVGRTGVGGGTGTTGLGASKGSGTDEMGIGGSEGTGTGEGTGGGKAGPGSGGYDLLSSRANPNFTIVTRTGDKTIRESPQKKELAEEKRLEREEFKADLGKGMTDVATQQPGKPVSRGFEDALQEEINKDLYSLRKMYEDWQNLKIPDIPKALQITIELNTEEGKPKILSINFHNATLSPRIKDDLTKKIRGWKFKSLYDGKDDPQKWPIKLTGRVTWQ